MSQKKIIKNQSGSLIQIINREIDNGSEYDVPPHFWSELAVDDDITALVLSEDLIVNDGNLDLPPNVAISHLQNIQGVIRNHSDITLLPAITVNAPEVIKISDATIGFCMELDNEIYGQSRVNNYIGGTVEIEFHMALDNSDIDKWVQFEISYITTNGYNDKNMNTPVGTLIMGPVEVPSIPWRVFESVVTIPEIDMSNGESYIYIGVKRVAATGKNEPTNHPSILRYCKRYWEKLES